MAKSQLFKRAAAVHLQPRRRVPGAARPRATRRRSSPPHAILEPRRLRRDVLRGRPLAHRRAAARPSPASAGWRWRRGAPIVPVGDLRLAPRSATGSGSQFPKVTVQYGEPFRFEQVESPTREQAQAAAEILFERDQDDSRGLREHGRAGTIRAQRAAAPRGRGDRPAPGALSTLYHRPMGEAGRGGPCRADRDRGAVGRAGSRAAATRSTRRSACTPGRTTTSRRRRPTPAGASTWTAADAAQPARRADRPGDQNRADGFSPGNMIVTHVPGLDNQKAFENTGASRSTTSAPTTTRPAGRGHQRRHGQAPPDLGRDRLERRGDARRRDT